MSKKRRYRVGEIVRIEPLAGQKFVVDGVFVRNGEKWYQLSAVQGTPTNLNVSTKHLSKIVIPDDRSKS